MAETPDLPEHPIISLFRNTGQEDFPLILVIGSGVNDDLPANDEIGVYDFKNVLHSELRSSAYKIVAISKGKPISFVSELCKQKGSSILAFADISPVVKSNKVRNRDWMKNRIRPKDYVQRARKIMSKDIFERTVMVMFSGLEHERYKEAVQSIEARCRAAGKMMAKPLLLSVKKERGWAGVKTSLSERELDYVAAIFERWVVQSTFLYLESYSKHQEQNPRYGRSQSGHRAKFIRGG